MMTRRQEDHASHAELHHLTQMMGTSQFFHSFSGNQTGEHQAKGKRERQSLSECRFYFSFKMFSVCLCVCVCAHACQLFVDKSKNFVESIFSCYRFWQPNSHCQVSTAKRLYRLSHPVFSCFSFQLSNPLDLHMEVLKGIKGEIGLGTLRKLALLHIRHYLPSSFIVNLYQMHFSSLQLLFCKFISRLLLWHSSQSFLTSQHCEESGPQYLFCFVVIFSIPVLHMILKFLN